MTPYRTETVACPTCGRSVPDPFIEAEDDLTGRPGRFTFVRCRWCGLVYQSPRLRLDEIRQFYDAEYIAHRRRRHGGVRGRLFDRAMRRLDRAKLRIVERYARVGRDTAVLDVGCGAGSFLAHLRERHGAAVAGVDFADLGDSPSLRGVEFHEGLFYEAPLADGRFDVVTMWHFLEHDYDPRRSLATARRVLRPGGLAVIEVPRLDSLSFRLFGERWPGLQAPQHTVLFDRRALVDAVGHAGFELVAHLPFGAFPPYFYLFCGVAFRRLKGRGLDLRRAMPWYFTGAVALAPVLPLLQYANFAMQTVICRAPGRS